MSTDYTPTDSDVKSRYAASRVFDPQVYRAAEREFDAWLTAHDAQVRAEERERIVRDLRAKFGITNRAADWVERSGKEQDRD